MTNKDESDAYADMYALVSRLHLVLAVTILASRTPPSARTLVFARAMPVVETETFEPARADARELHVAEGIAMLRQFRNHVANCPDYALIGKGWHYPETRSGYRSSHPRHASLVRSTRRQQQSVRRVDATIAALEALEAQSDDSPRVRRIIGDLLFDEAGFEPDARIRDMEWTASAIVSFVKHEAIHPLRAFRELVLNVDEVTTMSGLPLPRQAVKSAMEHVVRAIVEGRFPQHRFDTAQEEQEEGGGDTSRALNARRMVAGLQNLNKQERWRSSFRATANVAVPSSHASPLTTGSTHVVVTVREAEDASLLWATKIGGPSHGHDYETPCILPLLSNARHKAAILEAPHLQHDDPVGRAHVRLLEWHNPPTSYESAPSSAWLVYLEPLNIDFNVAPTMGHADFATLEYALLVYAIHRSIDIGVNIVSVGMHMSDAVDRFIGESRGVVVTAASNCAGCAYDVRVTRAQSVRYILTPSNGVIEASDTLSDLHDWVQDDEQLSVPMRRIHVVISPRGE